MIAYPNNKIDFKVISPEYIKNDTSNKQSRYSVYRKITNLPFQALEVKLLNTISKNPTYEGYYYTTKENETLQQISKKYYNTERLWWIIAKANNLKNESLITLNKNTTIIIPQLLELTKENGYFNL